MNKLTQKYIKSILEYDDLTGIFRWKITTKKIKYGDIANHIRKDGYLSIRHNKKSYMQHVLAWIYFFGELPHGEIDHIDHCRTNNKIKNLRLVFHDENNKNKTMQKNNSSGFCGVYLIKKSGKFYSQIRINGKGKHLGNFNTLEDAISARIKANIQYGFRENHGKS